MAKTVEQSVMEKLASDLFTNEERGYILESIEGGDQPQMTEEDAYLQKVAEVVNGIEVDPEILKEALELDNETLSACIDKVASEMDPFEAEIVIEKAAADVQQIQEQQQQIEKVGFELGVAMFGGFNAAAAEFNKEAAEQQSVSEVAQRAPKLAAALGIR